MSKKPKKKPPFNKNSVIRSALRRAFSRSPVVREVMQAVRRERDWFRKDGTKASKPRVEYQCSCCKQWYMGKEISVDHCDSVIDNHVGFIDWNTFVDRLFCSKENLSVLCDFCHTIKTNKEKAIAVERRRNLKEPSKTQ